MLLYNLRLDKQWSKKLDNRWMGPYTITDMAEDRSTCMLAEVDGTALSSVYPGERLKEFFPRRGIDRQEVEGYEENAADDEEMGENEAEEAEVGGDVAAEKE